MGTCSQCITHRAETETIKSQESVHIKMRELNQLSKSTMFETMKTHKQLKYEIYLEDSELISEINNEGSDVPKINGSIKQRNRAYSFQGELVTQKKITIKNHQTEMRSYRATDPNMPRIFSSSSSSNSQFKDFHYHYNLSNKHIVEVEDSKSLHSILKKPSQRKSSVECKSVHFAKKLSQTNIKTKSRSCHQPKKKKHNHHKHMICGNVQF